MQSRFIAAPWRLSVYSVLGGEKKEEIMRPDFAQQLASLTCGDHLYLIYDSSVTALTVASTYIRSGLRCGEKCVYILADHTVDEAAEALGATGVDVEQERERGSLQLLEVQDFPFTEPFQYFQMYEWLRAMPAQASGEGFSGLRFTVEMTWALLKEIPYEDLITLESLLDVLIHTDRCLSAVCMYNREHFPVAMLNRVAVTHPLVVVGREISPSFPYDPVEAGMAAREQEQSVLLGSGVFVATEAKAMKQLAFLAEAGRVLGSSLNYEQTLDTVAHLAVPLLADYCMVGILGEDAMLRRVAVAHAEQAKELSFRVLQRYPPIPFAEEGLPGALLAGKPLLFEEVSEEVIEALAWNDEHKALIRALQLRSIMIVPLVARHRTTGIITLASAESGRVFGEDDLAFAGQLAERAALAIDNARLYGVAQEVIRVREQKQQGMAALAHEVQAGATLEGLLREIVKLVARTLGVEYSKVLELLPEGDVLLLRAGVGWQEGLVGKALVSAGADSQAGYTLLTRAPVVVEDLHTETRFHGPMLLKEHGVVSGLSVPIKGQREVFGVLGAHSHRHHHFTDDDIYFMETVAHILATAIEMERTGEQLHRSNEMLNSLIRASPLAIAAFGRDDNVTMWNEAMEKMFGWRADEVLGKRFPIVPTEGEEEFRRFREALFAGRAFVSRKVQRTKKDGSGIHVNLSVAPLYDASHTIIGYVAVLEDVTEQKRIEAALARAEARLAESREAERLYLARELHDEAVQSLIGIAYGLQERERRVERGTEGRLEDASERIKDLRRLRKEVLDVVAQLRRVIRDLRPPGLEELGLASALRGYVSQLAREGSERMPEIELALEQVGKQLPYSVALALFRIAQEALRNALKHAGAERITLRLRLEPDAVTLAVQDDGCGFQVPTQLELLAEQGHFGLVGIAERATRAGGHYVIRSAPGEGTEVLVRIPFTELEE